MVALVKIMLFTTALSLPARPRRAHQSTQNSEFHMEFLVTRAELLLVCRISNSLSYELHKDGSLSQPKKWCGSGKRFCLRTAAHELAMLNNLEPPTDTTIQRYWNSIVSFRYQKEALKLAQKSQC